MPHRVRGMKSAALVLLIAAVVVASVGVPVQATAVVRRNAPPSFIVAETWYVELHAVFPSTIRFWRALGTAIP